MKLKEYASKIGVTYRTALKYFKQGIIKNAIQMPTGTILVFESESDPVFQQLKNSLGDAGNASRKKEESDEGV